MALHHDDLSVDATLVHRLLVGTAYAGLPVTPMAVQGSTNVLFRLGAGLLLRLPRQPGGSASIAKEARWLPTLRLPVATPEIEYVGSPAGGYPEQWSVVRWLDEKHPVAGAGGAGLGRDLARVLEGLSTTPVPPAAVDDHHLRSYRAGPLAAIDRDLAASIAACHELPGLELDLAAIEALWRQARDLSPLAAAPTWLHGDLVAENLLVRANRLSAVLDFGTLCVGDPAADLIVAWEVLDATGRTALREALGIDDATWLRGRAWAAAIAVITLAYYWHSMPRRCHDRIVMARAALSG